MLEILSRLLHLHAYVQVQKIIRALVASVIGLSMVISAYPMRAIAAVPPAPDFNFKLLAAGERESILALTALNATTPHNGSVWYYNDQSMGFANAGSTIQQSSADVNSGSDPLRLSWHTSSTHVNSGWRVGEELWLNSSTDYSRFVYESNTLPSYYPNGPQINVDPDDLTGWSLCYSGTYADSVLKSTLWAACDGTYLLLAGAALPMNKIDVQRDGSSVLSNIGGNHNGSPAIDKGNTLNFSLFESDGTTPIVWGAYRVYISNCNVGSCSPGNPIGDTSNWDVGTVTGSSYLVPEGADGRYIAVLVADDVTGVPVNANWIRIEIDRTPSTVSISDCEALMNIGSTGFYEDTYVLTKNIDCSGIDFTPITWESSSDFRGTFDGKGYKISNLTIDKPDDDEVGLFQELQDAIVKNLIIENANITGYEEVGTVAGEVDNSSIINVRVSGNVAGSESCEYDIGGIVGDIDNDNDDNKLDRLQFSGNVTADCDNVGGLIGRSDEITITRSRAYATVSGEDDIGGIIGDADETNIIESSAGGNVNGDDNIGGLIGRHGFSTTSRSYATGNVNGNSMVGGLIGGNGTIVNSYATGSVNGDNSVGGLMGNCTNGAIVKSYSIGVVNGLNIEQSGGLAGYSEFCDDTVNFWDTESSTLEFSAAGMGKTTAEMKTLATYMPGTDDWDFESVWYIGSVYNNNYPCLQWDEVVCVGDGDNISYQEEDFAPNSGDANNDGIPDSAQKHVTSFVNPLSEKYVSIETSSSCDNTDVGSSSESTTVRDVGYDYEHGLLNFTAMCETPGYTTTVKLYYYGVSKEYLVLRKHKPSNNAYFTISSATMTETELDGKNLTTVTYSITDGGELDLDGIANGTIVDPVGLANVVIGTPNTGVGGLLRIKLY